MTTYERACRLSIYLGNADIRRHKALSAEILHLAHRAGLRGASTLQGIQGYGHSHKIHDTPKWSVLDRTPITVHLIDAPDKIQVFLSRLGDLADSCLIVCDEVDVAVATPGSHPGHSPTTSKRGR